MSVYSEEIHKKIDNKIKEFKEIFDNSEDNDKVNAFNELIELFKEKYGSNYLSYLTSFFFEPALLVKVTDTFRETHLNEESESDECDACETDECNACEEENECDNECDIEGRDDENIFDNLKLNLEDDASESGEDENKYKDILKQLLGLNNASDAGEDEDNNEEEEDNSDEEEDEEDEEEEEDNNEEEEDNSDEEEDEEDEEEEEDNNEEEEDNSDEEEDEEDEEEDEDEDNSEEDESVEEENDELYKEYIENVMDVVPMPEISFMMMMLFGLDENDESKFKNIIEENKEKNYSIQPNPYYLNNQKSKFNKFIYKQIRNLAKESENEIIVEKENNKIEDESNNLEDL